ncbi:MAG TPA: efflux RND transporter periplasmic adaptor subunit [Woeseiaceae bacterium]
MRYRLLALIVAGASGLLASACQTGEARGVKDEAAAPLPVEVALPGTADVAAVFAATAPLAADRDALVAARVAGRVVEILAEEGDRVRAGQPLARLDGERAALEMRKARADFERAERELARATRLRDRGLISAAAFETCRYDRDALAATFELKRLAFEHTTIRATIDGVLAERRVKVGWRLAEGEPAFRIADTRRLVALLYIPQSQIGRIQQGEDVTITVDALPGSRVAANIDRISPTIDADNGSFRATIYVDNADGTLAPGMFGRFDIAWETHAQALVVPTRALLREDGEDVLYVVRDGAAWRQPVEIGIGQQDVTEIVSGLAGSDAVVISGQGSLRDGSPVVTSDGRDTQS